MGKIFVYKIRYMNGHTITHYNPQIVCDMCNEYNQKNNYHHRFNKNKLYRYSSYGAVPSIYRSLEKQQMRDFLELPNSADLSVINYRKMYDDKTRGILHE